MGGGRHFIKEKTPSLRKHVVDTAPACGSTHVWQELDVCNKTMIQRVAKDFIVENGIQTTDWSSNSPNLNLIENM